MIYTGLNWSGDPGDPVRRPGASPLLLVVAASMATEDLASLRVLLAKVRRARRLPESHPFKHLPSWSGVREAIFREISPLRLRIPVKVVEKRDWSREHIAASDGLSRTEDAIIDLVCCCPDELVANQEHLVDFDRGAARELRIIRTSLRRALSGIGRRTFENV